MTLLPLIQDGGDVQLQVAFNLSDPPTIRNFTSKDGNSYIEMPYTKLRSLSQKTNLRAGQALVLTGFDQSNTRMTKTAPLPRVISCWVAVGTAMILVVRWSLLSPRS
ncbi:TPA: hypothetical protein ACTAHG_001124 [Salmonella enterica subsp. enterica serovar Typhi]|nr:hypothetical protein MYA98_12265 [Salmonella sp. WGH-01]